MAKNRDNAVQRVPVREAHISSFRPQEDNANKHTERGLAALGDAIQRDGWIGGITVAADGEAFDGSARLEKLGDIGMEDALVVDIDGTRPVILRRTDIPSAKDPRAVRLGVGANRIAQLDLNFDTQMLVDLDLASPGLLEGLYTDGELQDMVEELEVQARGAMTPPEPGDGGDDFDPTPKDGPTRALRGDIWKIGPHYLMCGDCRRPEDMNRLFQALGKPADAFFTSPPYAEQREEFYDSVPEMDYVDWWDDVQYQARKHLADDGQFFLNIKPHARDGERALYVMDLVLSMRRKWRWKYVDEFSWLRVTAPGWWPDRLKNGFEPIYQFALGRVRVRHDNIKYPGQVPDRDSPIANNAGTGTYYRVREHNIEGMALPNNVINIPTTDRGIDHPAIFPVALPMFFMQAFSDPGDIWCDPFMGSGSLLISAHRANRVAVGLELSPAYCDVILSRALAEGIGPIERITGAAEHEPISPANSTPATPPGTPTS